MKKFKKYYKLLLKNKFLIIVFVIFLFELFLRTYQLDLKNPFGYDQVDNAWVAKNLIEEGKLPRYNSARHLLIEEAKKIKKAVQLGE